MNKKLEKLFDEEFGYMNDGGMIDMSGQYNSFKSFIDKHFIAKEDTLGDILGKGVPEAIELLKKSDIQIFFKEDILDIVGEDRVSEHQGHERNEYGNWCHTCHEFIPDGTPNGLENIIHYNKAKQEIRDKLK